MTGFRVDANEHIASGHLIRCMTIAKECVRQGVKCMFFLADNGCEKMVRKNGFSYIILNVPWDDWNAGIEKIQAAVKEYSITKLVVDSYLVTPYFLNYMNEMVPVIYLDDMCRRAYQISGVIHYSQWQNENTMERLYEGSGTKILAGMKYVPLREEFAEKGKDVDAEKHQIMITTGGTDTFHISLKVAEKFLKEKQFEKYTLLVVLGCMNQDEEVFRKMERESSRLTVKKNVNNMAQLMRESIAAVCAGGTTVYEFCACKVPMVCFSFADNHVEFGKEFQRRDILLYSGDARYEQQVPDNIAANLKKLLNHPDMMEKFKQKMSELVDGQGARRIVNELLM